MKLDNLKFKFIWLVALFACLQLHTYAQCELSGEVIDGTANGACGILIQTADNTLYEPVASQYDLVPGQIVSFSFTPGEISTPCSIAIPINLTCFENTSDDCINEVDIDLAAQCNGYYAPVCGCNGQTYINACQAENWYGVSDWEEGACPGVPVDCEASFMFGFLPNNQIIFYNNSQGYSHFTWDFGEGPVSSGESTMLVDNFTSGTLVCLEVWNDEGCYDELCLPVTPDAPEEMCNISDCIWPGDANGDGAANNYDLLNIGLGMATTGPARPFFPFPEAPNTWAPNYGSDWNAWVDVVNFKHLDSDGDGVVHENDILAIEQNYVADTEFTSTPTPGAPVVYVEFESEVIIIDELTPQLMSVSADLYVGGFNLPVSELHGLALGLTYSTDFIHPGTIVDIDYFDNSFFGPSHEVLFLEQAVALGGDSKRIDVGLSQKSNPLGVEGYGKIATMNFVVNADIIDGLALPEVSFEITVEKIKMIDGEGKDLEFDLNPQNASLVFINDGVSGTNPVPPIERINVFPNPVQDELFIQLDGLPGQYFELVDVLGKTVISHEMDRATTSFSVQSFSPGIYWLRVQTEKGLLSKKVVIAGK